MKTVKSFFTVFFMAIFWGAVALAAIPTLSDKDYIPPFGIGHDHWAFALLNNLTACSIEAYWQEHAYKEAHRLELVEVFAKTLVYLEKRGLIQTVLPRTMEALTLTDIPAASPYFPLAAKVIRDYHLISVKGNYLDKGAELTAEELQDSVVKFIGQLKNVSSFAGTPGFAATREVLAFPIEPGPVKRFTLLAAAAKIIALAEKSVAPVAAAKQVLPKQAVTPRILPSAEVEAPPKSVDILPSRFSLGGQVGHVFEAQSGTNNFAMTGGQVSYEKKLNEHTVLELQSSVSSYPMVYLEPHSGGVTATTVLENKIDFQLNAKNQINKNFFDGIFFLVYGLHGLALNSAMGSAFVGLRGALEYRRPLVDRLKWQAWVGATTKLFSSTNAVLGSPSSDIDYGLQMNILLMPGQALTLGYLGNSLIFNQSYTRMFNSLVISTGWAMGAPVPHSRPAGLLIDDFEGGTFNVNPLWWVFDGVSPEVVSTANFREGAPEVIRDTSKYSLLIKGKARGNWYAGGMGVYIAKPGQDLSAYRNLQLDVYGFGPGFGRIKVELFDDDNGNWNMEQHTLEASAPLYDDRFVSDILVDWVGWKRVIIPFSDFKDDNPKVGDNIWNPEQTNRSGGWLQMQFIGLASEASGALQYAVDNVRLTK
ncbi:hypothetical protein HZB07_04915 [Candidatus Saganbacteria bacterium]|nr:hypothetical protein [Candidatus Saganbacteria bacterium]